MIAIETEMPKNCIDCEEKGIRLANHCRLIFDGKADIERHPNCPLVEIVTCKDCKYYRPDDDTGYCTNHTYGDIEFWCRDDYYCADGERRE